mmetsp:Transcript_43555/g.72359  ORF Transcript_43555/g.72359 Transcript_43555/m.72359 type:complete len:249 (-) Transcript_43555:41-787(-)
MALKVATMFCCGFPVSYGVWIIMLVHLLTCIFYVYAAWMNVVFHQPAFGANWTSSMQMYATILCISGIVIILAAMYGVYRRIEVNVRIYLYFLFLCFVVDTYTVLKAFLFQDVCAASGMLLELLGDTFGKAFMCGFLRIAAYFMVAAVVSVEVYCLFIVWSYCEDVHEGMNGHGLENMLPTKEAAFKKVHRRHGSERAYTHADIIGLSHQKIPGPYPSPYGALESNSLVSKSIFGGNEHEMNYPPKNV